MPPLKTHKSDDPKSHTDKKTVPDRLFLTTQDGIFMIPQCLPFQCAALPAVNSHRSSADLAAIPSVTLSNLVTAAGTATRRQARPVQCSIQKSCLGCGPPHGAQSPQ